VRTSVCNSETSPMQGAMMTKALHLKYDVFEM